MAASEVVKLRMKIGLHEFEAKGPYDRVMAQLDAWNRLAGLGAENEPGAPSLDAVQRALFSVDPAQKLIALRLNLSGRHRNANAALLILYGYRTSFPPEHGDEIPAARLKAALIASGYGPKRFDRAIAPHLASGLIRKGGPHKRSTYALTVPGHERAAALARHLSVSR